MALSQRAHATPMIKCCLYSCSSHSSCLPHLPAAGRHSHSGTRAGPSILRAPHKLLLPNSIYNLLTLTSELYCLLHFLFGCLAASSLYSLTCFFLQIQCSSLTTLISVFSPYPSHFPSSLPSARNLEIDLSSFVVYFCVASSKEENALPRWVVHLLPTSHCTNITPMCRQPKQFLHLLRLHSRPPNWTQKHSNTLNLGVELGL